MPVSGLEALADAIMHYEGWKPGSRSYRNRNPGNLCSPKYPKDDNGYNVFFSLAAGYGALLADLNDKATGDNTHGLGPDSTLYDLFRVYAPAGDGNMPGLYASFAADWISKVLGKEMNRSTKLKDIWQP